MTKSGEYKKVIVETFVGPPGGLNGIHVRPIPNQPFPTTLLVECSRKLITDYPLGTRFRIRAKLTDVNGAPFLYSYYGWRFEVLER